MPYTHDYKLEIGDYQFNGEVEISNAGLVALTETSQELMALRMKEVVRKILEELGTLPSVYTDLKSFELILKK